MDRIAITAYTTTNGECLHCANSSKCKSRRKKKKNKFENVKANTI